MAVSGETFTVHALRRNGRRNLEVELAPPEGASLPPFEAGAHVDVTTPSGAVRQYSLCNGPDERKRYRICIQIETPSRGGSISMHRDLRIGTEIRVSPPRNFFALPSVENHLLFAAGIGITPIMAMATTLAARDAPFELHYYFRDREEAAFVDELMNSRFAQQVILYDSRAGHSIRHAAPEALRNPSENAAIMVCGPSGFMLRLEEWAIACGWRQEQICGERFTPAVREQPRDDEAAGVFDVCLVSTGQNFRVEAHESIAEVLKRNGVAVELSCEQGMCGACLTGVIEGVPDHRDEILTAAERAAGDQLTICCSRASSKLLVLDL